MNLNLVARRILPVPVVSIAAVGPYEVTTFEAWQHLRHLLEAHGIRGRSKPVFAVLRDMPQDVRPENRRLELCAPLDKVSLEKLQSVATVGTFPGGAYLSTTHRGSYQQLPHVYGQMYAACSLDMNIALDGKRPRVILFHGDPTDVRHSELTAELCMPVSDQMAERPRNVA